MEESMTGTRRTHRRIIGNRKWPGGSGVGAIGGNGRLVPGLSERQAELMGAAVLAYADVNIEFRHRLREAFVAEITDPQDMALLPEYFRPRFRLITVTRGSHIPE
jgi:hypothetical protein